MSQLIKDRYSQEVLDFCEQRGLAEKLDLVVNLMNQTFPQAQRVIVEVEVDPEGDDRYIMVDAIVSGTAWDIGSRHRECVRQIADLLRWPMCTWIRTTWTLI